ncbi:hypothetical protein [Reyranella massiliensis]|uniref:hypothetical protein n=1 Tax=Reyranella massiliensis TaxID=445220 RepID=UPI0005C28B3A|nr:hypothetical protein [Reyranella massiliensis]
MSKHRKDVLMDCLSGQDMKLANIKFFRGSNETISDEQFRDELHGAAERKRKGEVKPSLMAPWKERVTDLREFVSTL